MLIYPAIDLRKGRCVRLRQGDPGAETIFGDDPAAVARRWADQGAQWLHVVNLDGALGDQPGDAPNLRRLREIREAVDLPIQFGGGLRTLADMEQALTLGATRVVLGTLAIHQPSAVDEAVRRFGAEHVVVGLDARQGRVAIHGWQEVTELDATSLARQFRDMGLLRAVYTDIERDGMLSGVNVEATADLARGSGLQVIASGGVRGMEDIRRLTEVASCGVEGVIVGQALYTGSLDLAQAIALTSGN